MRNMTRLKKQINELPIEDQTSLHNFLDGLERPVFSPECIGIVPIGGHRVLYSPGDF